MKEAVRLIFLGTSGVCIPFLEELYRRFDIPLIITQPDAVGGRNRKQTIIPPVKTFALEHHIEVTQPEILKDDALVERIQRIEPVLGVVVSYGKMIPKRIFKVPVHGTINVHFSLLPFYRGAAPVQRAIEKGDTMTGITIFEIVKKMDAGDIRAQREMEIRPDDTTGTLWERMSREGAPFLVDTIHAILENKIGKTPQDHEKATYAPEVQKEEGVVNWRLTARQIFNKFRAFTPWPGISVCICDKRFKLTEVKISHLTHDKKPGDVLSRDRESLKVCCGSGTVLEILELQPPGKKSMTPYCYCLGNELPDCLA
jgi:methionyl-tRNA formyltransferase